MFKIDVAGNGWKRLRQLMVDYEKRSSMLQLVATKRIVDIFLEHLKGFIPDDMKTYKESLRVVKIVGLDEGITFAIVSDADKDNTEDLDLETTAVYIVNKSKSKLLNILEEFSPWTLDTLPIGFNPKDAEIVYRNITKGEFLRLRDERRQTLFNIKDFLVRYGGKEPSVNSARDIMDISAMPDLAFQVIRMELGLGVKRIPHWSRALRELEKWVRNDFLKSGIFQDYLADEKFNKYKESEDSITNEDMSYDGFKKQFSDFEQKIKKLS